MIAEYRRHGTNMTRGPGASLRDRIDVLRKQRRTLAGGARHYREAYRAGLAFALTSAAPKDPRLPAQPAAAKR